VTVDGPEPLGVWDPRSREWADEHMQARADWAVANLERAGDTYLVEFYLIDLPFAVLHRVRRNEHGRPYLDALTGELAVELPATQLLGSLPPAHLR
jgi:hypothetical protein